MTFRLPIITAISLALCACGSTGQTKPSSVSAAGASQTIAQNPQTIILDVRTREEFADGHLPGAKLIPWTDQDFTARAMKELDREKPVLVYCARGSRSRAASEKLAKLGFHVSNLEGGIHAWKRGGHPIVTPSR